MEKDKEKEDDVEWSLKVEREKTDGKLEEGLFGVGSNY